MIGSNERARRCYERNGFRLTGHEAPRERDGRIRLQPENSSLEPLFPEHVEILGKVTGVFRSL